jgi:hypothetical protein
VALIISAGVAVDALWAALWAPAGREPSVAAPTA